MRQSAVGVPVLPRAGVLLSESGGLIMGTVAQRPWDFGIIYYASGAVPLPTYTDAKGVTQTAIAINTMAYTEMTTTTSAGVDTSKPYAGNSDGLTLSCEFGFSAATEYKFKLQCKRVEETLWKDLQIALQSDPGTVAAAQTITGSNEVVAVVFQTASVFTVQQIRVVAYASAGAADDAGDFIIVRGEVG